MRRSSILPATPGEKRRRTNPREVEADARRGSKIVVGRRPWRWQLRHQFLPACFGFAVTLAQTVVLREHSFDRRTARHARLIVLSVLLLLCPQLITATDDERQLPLQFSLRDNRTLGRWLYLHRALQSQSSRAVQSRAVQSRTARRSTGSTRTSLRPATVSPEVEEGGLTGTSQSRGACPLPSHLLPRAALRRTLIPELVSDRRRCRIQIVVDQKGVHPSAQNPQSRQFPHHFHLARKLVPPSGLEPEYAV